MCIVCVCVCLGVYVRQPLSWFPTVFVMSTQSVLCFCLSSPFVLSAYEHTHMRMHTLTHAHTHHVGSIHMWNMCLQNDAIFIVLFSPTHAQMWLLKSTTWMNTQLSFHVVFATCSIMSVSPFPQPLHFTLFSLPTRRGWALSSSSFRNDNFACDCHISYVCIWYLHTHVVCVLCVCVCLCVYFSVSLSLSLASRVYLYAIKLSLKRIFRRGRQIEVIMFYTHVRAELKIK